VRTLRRLKGHFLANSSPLTNTSTPFNYLGGVAGQRFQDTPPHCDKAHRRCSSTLGITEGAIRLVTSHCYDSTTHLRPQPHSTAARDISCLLVAITASSSIAFEDFRSSELHVRKA
jgi:hypothetical protein